MVYVRAVSMQFLNQLPSVVTVQAQALHLTTPEQGSIAPMWGNVIAYRGGCDLSSTQALGA